jgi:hypothetical protein
MHGVGQGGEHCQNISPPKKNSNQSASPHPRDSIGAWFRKATHQPEFGKEFKRMLIKGEAVPTK